jgi:Protein of unknown function, DUF547
MTANLRNGEQQRMKTLRAATVILFLFLLAQSCFVRAADFDAQHGQWTRLLARHVTNGLVQYASIHADPTELDHYLDSLAQVSEEQFNAWHRPEQLAFLINLYNAATVQLIIQHYPVSSIRKIGTVWKGPWKQETVRLWGKVMTLDALEHEIIRPRYQEPRIHFALVCAAQGCPPLRSEAFVGARLDVQLDDQARQFLAASQKNRVDAKERTVYLSPIFKWYAGDFEAKSGSVLSAIRPFWPSADAAAMDLPGLKVRYTDYDWSLNERSDRQP